MHPVGIFVLVLAIYYPHDNEWREYQIVTKVEGFKSWALCEAAGMEAQARFNNKQAPTATQQLDFVCLYQGKGK